MTDKQQPLHFDPEGLLPPEQDVKQFAEDVDKAYSLTISELSEAQFDTIKDGILQAFHAAPDRNLTGRFAGKIATLAVLMVFVASAVWVVAWLMSNLPAN